jgi:hypothetical protein
MQGWISLLLVLLALSACQTPTATGPDRTEVSVSQGITPRVTAFMGPQSQQAQGEIRLLVVPVRFSVPSKPQYS